MTPANSSQLVASMPKKKKAKKAKHRGPETTDRHRLYELSVQSPEEHIRWFDEFYSKRVGRLPRSLKEDFCGTALLSAHWVAARPDNTAVGVDLDRDTLEWGRAHNVEPLDEDQRSRISLLERNVLDVREPKVDVVAALNFSYFVFYTRKELRDYFTNVRKSLAPRGIFVLDIFGGWESQTEETDRTRYKGYTYAWEQTKFDPVSNRTQFRIHFKFHGGGGIKDAFVYDWRLWSVPEVREVLAEAGFGHVDVYWEGIDDETGEGSGEYSLVSEAESTPGWVAFVVASR